MIITELSNSIAYEVTTGITQLVEFLARVVKVYFGKDMPKERMNSVGAAIGKIGNNNVPAIEMVPEESGRYDLIHMWIAGIHTCTVLSNN